MSLNVRVGLIGLFALSLAACGSHQGRDVGKTCANGFVPPDCVAPTDTPAPPDETVVPVSGEAAVIVQHGTSQSAKLLRGTVIGPDGPFEGEVLVVGQLITCAAASCADEPEAGQAWIIDTRGLILPGLIDAHNHILFNTFNEDDWLPNLPKSCATADDCTAGSPYCSGDGCRCAAGVCRYKNHTQWTGEAEYQLVLDYKQCLEDASQGKPDWCPQSLDEDGDVKCEMQKWGELKGLVAGTTSIVGLPGTTSKCVGSLTRSIDVSQNDLEHDKIQTSALFPPSKSSADGVCKNFGDGDTDAYVIHVGEGLDGKALAEFGKLYTISTDDGCLFSPKTTITHGTAFGEPEFVSMAEAGMKLVWSPQSNVTLYGDTADIPTALAMGVTVALAPDWSLGGSQNLLDELRFADSWDNSVWGDVLSARDLFDMVTSNAATALGLSEQLGSIRVGHIADLIVLPPGDGTPYEALLASRPADVRLVMIGGVVLYGDAWLEPVVPASPGCEALDLCGASKFICVAEDDPEHKLSQTLAEIQAALESATQAIDGLKPLPVAECGGCPAGEECFAYQAKPAVDPALCPAACAPDETCIQAKKSGDNQNQCLPNNTCSPRKSDTLLSPIAPLAKCAGGVAQP